MLNHAGLHLFGNNSIEIMASPQLLGVCKAIRSGTKCRVKRPSLMVLHRPSLRKCFSFEIVSIKLHSHSRLHIIASAKHAGLTAYRI